MAKKLGKIDTSNVTSFSGAFQNCSGLNDIPDIDTNKATSMDNMFTSCTGFSAINFKNFNTSTVTSMSSMFSSCANLKSIDLSNLITNKLNNIYSMFSGCTNVEKINMLDSSNVSNARSAFYNCKSLKELSKFNGESLTGIDSMFKYDNSLTNFEGIINLGKGYISPTSNYNMYKLDLSYCNNLSYDSLISIINNLYDLNLTYNVNNGGTLYAQTLSLGSTNLAKLTEEEIAIATAKGWNVS